MNKFINTSFKFYLISLISFLILILRDQLIINYTVNIVEFFKFIYVLQIVIIVLNSLLFSDNISKITFFSYLILAIVSIIFLIFKYNFFYNQIFLLFFISILIFLNFYYLRELVLNGKILLVRSRLIILNIIIIFLVLLNIDNINALVISTIITLIIYKIISKKLNVNIKFNKFSLNEFKKNFLILILINACNVLINIWAFQDIENQKIFYTSNNIELTRYSIYIFQIFTTGSLLLKDIKLKVKNIHLLLVLNIFLLLINYYFFLGSIIFYYTLPALLGFLNVLLIFRVYHLNNAKIF